MTAVLILVPTAFELQKLQACPEVHFQRTDIVVETCGIGVIAAGISATRAIQKHQPHKVILAGIAGAISDAVVVGSAWKFSSVACYGIGVGSGSHFRTLDQLGWSDWHRVDQQSIRDVLLIDERPGPQLLTVCSASENQDDVFARRSNFPSADAEDMESYSVAVACRAANVPLTVLRGISNIAGDREKSRWKIDDSLAAVARLLAEELD